MAKKTRKKRLRDPMKRDLLTPKYRLRIVLSAKQKAQRKRRKDIPHE